MIAFHLSLKGPGAEGFGGVDLLAFKPREDARFCAHVAIDSSGWTVAHIETTCSPPPGFLDPLRRATAYALARFLDEQTDCPAPDQAVGGGRRLGAWVRENLLRFHREYSPILSVEALDQEAARGRRLDS